MSKTVKLPAKSLYSVADLVNALGYTRQSIATAVKEVCSNAEKTSKGYRLTKKEVVSIAEKFDIEVSFEGEKAQEKEDGQQSNELDLLKSTLDMLQEQLKEKDRQLAAKDKQIEALQANVSQLLDSNKALAANATLHTAKSIQDGQKEQEKEPMEIVPQKQRTFLDRLKDFFS